MPPTGTTRAKGTRPAPGSPSARRGRSGMRFLTWLLTNALALAVAAWLFDGIWFTGRPRAGGDQESCSRCCSWPLILGVVTAFVKPVLKLLSIPFIILTLGLFLLVINALMLLLTGWLAGQLDIGFHVDGFWTAVAARS